MKKWGKAIKRIVGVCFMCAAASVMSYVAYAENEAVTYEYGDEGIVNENLELELQAKAGEDYEITVNFTGISDSTTKISLGYDMVTNDQMVEVKTGDTDRSGLIDESVTEGSIETRTFNVAAVEDVIRFKASGQGRIVSITVKEYEKEKPDQTVIYTIGDSLVQTYDEYYAPQTGWGQVLQEYFDENNVLVKNHALGGRSSGSYMREGRLNEVLLNIKEGDYVLIEFGHNDASTNKEDRYTSVDDYKLYLKEQYIRPIEQRGGIPVLVTLVNRNDYNTTTGQFNISFERYVVAMREVAQETDTLLIDLNAMTVDYFTKLNKQHGIGITEAIIFNYAEAGQYTGAYSAGVADNTHLQKYGAKLVAGMVAKDMEKIGSDIVKASYTGTGEYKDVPKTPENIRKASEWSSLCKIAWDETEGADFYVIYATDITDGDNEDYELIGYSTVCEYEYMDAVVNYTYKLKVVAANLNGESGETEPIEYSLSYDTSGNTEEDFGVVVNEEENSNNESDNLLIAVIITSVVVVIAVGMLIFSRKNRAR